MLSYLYIKASNRVDLEKRPEEMNKIYVLPVDSCEHLFFLTTKSKSDG